MNELTSTNRIKNPVLFICDLQEKFRPAIYEFPAVLSTATKLVKAAHILSIPIFATTQQRAKLGNTCSELGLGRDGTHTLVVDADKSRFSMCIPEVISTLDSITQQSSGLSTSSDAATQACDCVIVGIETHICVLQTTLDLVARGHRVWIVADGVSSCNSEERGIALERCRQEGAKVTTSESIIYECLGDAKDERFKEINALVRETKQTTKENMRLLCRI